KHPIESGPLRGYFELEVSDDEFSALLYKKNSSSEYLQVCTRIRSIAESVVEKFCTLIRSKYGHYWIAGPVRTDPRVRTPIQERIQGVSYFWAPVDHEEFEPLIYVGPISVTVLQTPRESEYLTRVDWYRIEESMKDNQSLVEE